MCLTFSWILSFLNKMIDGPVPNVENYDEDIEDDWFEREIDDSEYRIALLQDVYYEIGICKLKSKAAFALAHFHNCIGGKIPCRFIYACNLYSFFPSPQ